MWTGRSPDHLPLSWALVSGPLQDAIYSFGKLSSTLYVPDSLLESEDIAVNKTDECLPSGSLSSSYSINKINNRIYNTLNIDSWEAMLHECFPFLHIRALLAEIPVNLG